MARSHPPTLSTRVKGTLGDECDLEPGAHLLIGVSGGPDSMALLHVLAQLRDRVSFVLSAHGVDHGVHPGSAVDHDERTMGWSQHGVHRAGQRRQYLRRRGPVATARQMGAHSQMTEPHTRISRRQWLKTSAATGAAGAPRPDDRAVAELLAGRTREALAGTMAKVLDEARAARTEAR